VDVLSRRELLKRMHFGVALRLSPNRPSVAEVDEIAETEREAMAASAAAFMTSFGVPGLSITIARNGSRVYEHTFGVANVESGERLNSTHLFRIASVTKPITSVAVFSLFEQQKLHLNDKVFGEQGILGTFYGSQPYKQFVEDVTVEHLLTHTAGGWQNDSRDPMFRFPQMDQKQLISWTLDNLPLERNPGERWAYSNFGYCVLGRVIEEVAGKPYRDFVQKTVLAPCGISDMRIANTSKIQRVRNEVTYYGQNGEDPYSPNMNIERMDSHGGWIATSGDLVDFALHVDGFLNTPNILSRATLAEMTKPTPANSRYAKGWAVNSLGNWWHIGSLPGTTSVMVRTSSGFCWAALANTRRQPSNEIDHALDSLIWEMVRKVRAWQA